jgi:uncharacterized BrkB/YihY/UPF0761 family membrane protein
MSDDQPRRASPSRRTKVSKRLGSARQHAVETRERLEAARPRSKLLNSLFGVAEHDVGTGGGVLAGAVGFRLFMLLVPYSFVVVATLGFVAGRSDESPSEVASNFGAAGLAATAVKGLADKSFWTGFLALAGGVVALLLAARAAVKTLRIVHGLIWGVGPPKGRGSTRAALGLILVVTVGLALARAITGIGGYLVHILSLPLLVGIPTGLWLAVSLRGLPHAEGATWRDVLPGAIVVGIGVEALHLFTVVWIVRLIENKSESYGVLGTALALLFWAYVLGRVLTLSAVVNASRWYQAHPRAR